MAWNCVESRLWRSRGLGGSGIEKSDEGGCWLPQETGRTTSRIALVIEVQEGPLSSKSTERIWALVLEVTEVKNREGLLRILRGKYEIFPLKSPRPGGRSYLWDQDWDVHRCCALSVDASEAGAGNLEIVVKCANTGQRIPNYLEGVEDQPGKFRIYFTPKASCFRYTVDATFNDEHIMGRDGAEWHGAGSAVQQGEDVERSMGKPGVQPGVQHGEAWGSMGAAWGKVQCNVGEKQSAAWAAWGKV